MEVSRVMEVSGGNRGKLVEVSRIMQVVIDRLTLVCAWDCQL